MYKVLLVDDEPAILKSEKRAIMNRTEGFEVVGEAHDVKKAISLYNHLEPHVVLTDIRMPGEDGISLVKYVSENRRSFPTLCIVVSGYSDFDYVRSSFINDAYDYLLKPINPSKIEELFRRIRNEIETRMDRDTENEESLSERIIKTGYMDLVERIKHYVESNLAGDNSIAAICKQFSISQPYLSKIFRKAMDCTFIEYLTDVKIKKAKELLTHRQDLLISDIASQLGFSDQFYFSKVFKSEEGCTPSEFRKKVMSESDCVDEQNNWNINNETCEIHSH
ncbi:MAG TPA: AraC family transcriptional regulator [Clostridiaceae bacterium]|nr:AraC family transcriptional regulator [Clostridiaceae bacterium]